MKYIYPFLFLLVVFVSCNTDDSLMENKDPVDQIANDTTDTEARVITDEEFAMENFGNTLSANFIGILQDIEGTPIPEVQITIGGQITSTDSNGIFVLNEVAVNENFAFISAEKSDYILGSRTIVPTNSGSNFITITLLKNNVIATVNSGESSSVSLPNGVEVDFSGSFIDADGSAYTGNVEVSMQYLDPNQESMFTQMPGMLYGKSEANKATTLESYGMVAVDLHSPSGEALNISKDAPAQIRFPISSSTPNAPETIALWYFDDVVGYWKEQGQATKVGDEYVAEVSHFTWWNPCLPLDSVSVCFELNVDVALSNSYFTIRRERNDNQLVVIGETNTNGMFCGVFPKDEVLVVSVFGACDTESAVAVQRIGPFTSSTSTLEITVADLSSYLTNTRLAATVTNCEDDPVKTGYAFVYSTADANDFKTVPISNGIINAPFTYCSDNEYRLIAYDIDAKAVSSEQNVNSIENGITNLGPLSVCEEDDGLVYEGSITLGTQEQVEAFGEMGYSRITGDLNILRVSERNSIVFDPTDITFLVRLVGLTTIEGDLKIVSNQIASLKGLENLTSVGGDVFISENRNLSSLADLNALTSIGGNLTFTYNHSLTHLKGLENLTSIGGSLDISYHSFLTSLTGLENVTLIGDYLKIAGNNNLTRLSALEKITSISGEVRIIDHPKLTTLEELKNLTSIGGFMILDTNPALTSLTGFEKLTSIGGKVYIIDTGITSLSGLDNLTSIGNDVIISRNKNLTSLTGLEKLSVVQGELIIGSPNSANQQLSDFCALTNLLNNGAYGEVTLSNNQYNPTVQDIKDGDCSE